LENQANFRQNLFSKTVTKAIKTTDREGCTQGDLTIYNRRLNRLEETQLTRQEIQLLFDNMTDKIDMLAEQIDRQFDWVEARCDRLEARCDRLESQCRALNRQLDLAIYRTPDRVERLND
jgi:DNA repair ATPase RecN